MSTLAVKGDRPQQIQVFVRTRPISRLERDNRSTNCIEILSSKEISVKQTHGKKYAFDKVFGPNTKQVDVYLTVVYPLISEVLAGYNCTVFAYGQTGAGKTYTMAGGSALANNTWQDDETAGIIPRTLAHLFDELRVLQQEHTVRVSYLELYNEELYDLLAETDDISRIRIFEDQHQKGSVIIQGIEEQTVLNKNEVYKILEKGQEKRRTAATLMNAQSSRSHTVFTITVHTRENTVEGEIVVKTGKLHLVDLAGSENIGKSGAVDKRAREAGSINQSLLTLGRVIKALVERGQHIPYRESKLTRILQDSLGGRTKTSIIANITLASSNLEETLSTLEYANRARNITNRPEVNLRTSQKGLITEYMNEINRLRKDLSAARTGSGVFLAQENYDKLIVDNEIKTEELAEKIVYIREIQEKVKNLEEQKAYVESEWNTLQVSFEESKKYIENISKELEKTTIEKEEEQHLAKCYEDRALKLYGQSNELLNVAKLSLKNEDQLHKKIESIREMANDNVKFIRSIIKKVTNFENMLANNLNEHMKSSDRTNKNLMELIGFSCEQISETRQQSIVFRNNLLDEIKTTSAKIFNDLTDQQRSNLEVWINDVYTNCVATMDRQNSICNRPIDGLFRNLSELMLESQQRHVDFYTVLSEQARDVCSSLDKCCKATESNMQGIIHDVLSECLKESGYLLDQQTCLNTHLQRVQNNQKDIQWLSSFFAEAQNVIQRLSNDTTTHEKDIKRQFTLNQNCVTSLTNTQHILENRIPEVLSSMNNTVKEIVTSQEDSATIIDMKKKEEISDTTKENLLEKIQTDTKAREEAILNKTQTLLVTVDGLNKDIKRKQTEIYKDCKLVVESHLQKIEETLITQTNSDEEAFKKSVDNFNIMERELAELEHTTNKTKEVVESTLSNTQDNLARLINNDKLDIKRYGDTPVRMQLPSSIRLSEPSPRHRILINYKEKNMQKLQVENQEGIEASSEPVLSNHELPSIREVSPLRIVFEPNRQNALNTDVTPNIHKSKIPTDTKKHQKENLSRENSNI